MTCQHDLGRRRRAVYTEIMTVFIVPTTETGAVGSGEVTLTPHGRRQWRPPRCGCGFLFIIFNFEADVDTGQPAVLVSHPNPGLPMAAVSGSDESAAE